MLDPLVYPVCGKN